MAEGRKNDISFANICLGSKFKFVLNYVPILVPFSFLKYAISFNNKINFHYSNISLTHLLGLILQECTLHYTIINFQF